MPAPKGHPKAGGRTLGTPNKVSAFIKSCICDAVDGYFQPSPTLNGSSQFEVDLLALTTTDRVKAVIALTQYIVPKQQAISIDDQVAIDAAAIAEYIEHAPDEAVEAIAARVLEIQAAKGGDR